MEGGPRSRNGDSQRSGESRRGGDFQRGGDGRRRYEGDGGNQPPPASHLPPQNLDMEEAILGAMLMSQGAIESAVDLGLREADFYRPSNRAIYRAIMSLADRDAVDELTVAGALERDGKLAEVGGKVALYTLTQRVPAVANARAYAQEVIDQSTLRQLVEAGHTIARMGYEHQDEPSTLVDNAQAMVSELQHDRHASDFVDATTLYKTIYDELYERALSGGVAKGLITGFTDFDKMTGGLQKSNLVIVAARPAMGKTSWALNVAEHVILREKKPVALFSLEMKADDLATRIMCSVAKVDQKRIRIGVPHEQDWPHLVDAMGKLSQAQDLLFIDDTGSLTPFELRTKCRRLHARLMREQRDRGEDQIGLGLIVIDYLQLMDPGKRVESDQSSISYISRQLKSLALELGVPIMAISQLSRAVEARADKKPMLADLRGSGSIEQDADIVLFLHRPEYYEPEKEELKGKAELIVAKHRNGEVGLVTMGFLARYTKFVNLSRQDMPPPPPGGGAGGFGPGPSGPPPPGGGDGYGGYDGPPVGGAPSIVV